MIPVKIKKMENFVGRRKEWERLTNLGQLKEPAILIVYGRRRVGKTELLEQVYADRNILKFEGIREKRKKSKELMFCGNYLNMRMILCSAK